ncbi:hypothetical protein D0862_11592, partial [Hortaea werneckii]
HALAIPPVVLLCVAAARELRKLTETRKTANKTLLSLLSRIQRLRLYLDSLHGLTSQLANPQERSMMLAFNENNYEATPKESQDFRLDVAARTQHGYTGSRSVRRLTKFLSELEQHERGMLLMLSPISAHSHLRTEHDIDAIKSTVRRQSSIKPKFQLSDEIVDEQAGSDNSTLVDGLPDWSSRPVAVWHCYVLREGFSDAYVKARDQLADDPYYGDRDSVIEMLESGRPEFGENWASAVRLSTKAKQSSRFRLLLDTVAPGSSFPCTGPCRVAIDSCKGHEYAPSGLHTLQDDQDELGRGQVLTSRPYTSRDSARSGFSDLVGELALTICHFVPPEVLQILQDGLHSMIVEDLNGSWWLDKLVLPDLHALTELEVPEMVFPIPRMMVYHVYLDGCELVAEKAGCGKDENSTWRLTKDEVYQDERAVLFNH